MRQNKTRHERMFAPMSRPIRPRPPILMKFFAMRLEGIHTGDIVEVDHRGRRFYALVTGPAPDGLTLVPMDRRVNYYSARSREVVGHWVKCGRPKTTTAPLQPSERQLEIDLGIQPQADNA
jgi:hypothetical protein